VQKTSSIVNPFGYKGALGYYSNPVTDDIDVRARIYKPVIARWLSRDPLFPITNANQFLYVGNRPLIDADPSGLASLSDDEPDDDSACGPKKECISDFAARTEKADACLGFDIKDVFCSKCTKSLKVVDSCANVEVTVEQTGKPKCIIKFKSQGKKCGICPKGGKRIVDGEVEVEK
jgi:RHS repeat-associated protein